MVHRFWTMLQAIWSSQVQVIFIPPWHFSTLVVQRGTIIQLAGAIAGEVPMPGMLGMPMPGIPIPVRSIIMLVIRVTPFSPT